MAAVTSLSAMRDSVAYDCITVTVRSRGEMDRRRRASPRRLPAAPGDSLDPITAWPRPVDNRAGGAPRSCANDCDGILGWHDDRAGKRAHARLAGYRPD